MLDWYLVLGWVDGFEGFCMCVGFSGYGFKIGLFVGELMVEEIFDGCVWLIDISCYNFLCFVWGDLIGIEYGGNWV